MWLITRNDCYCPNTVGLLVDFVSPSGETVHFHLRGCLESIKQVIFILGNGEQGTGNREQGTPKDWEGLGNRE